MAVEILRIVSDLVIVVGALAAGAITAFRYKRNREGAPRPVLAVSAEVHRVANVNIVDISIEVKNAGTVAVVAEAEQLESCFCEVRSVSCPDETHLHTFGSDTVELLLDEVNYLGTPPVDPDIEGDPKELIEPGTTETYHVIFSTEYIGPAWIHVEFHDKSDWISRADKLLVLA